MYKLPNLGRLERVTGVSSIASTPCALVRSGLYPMRASLSLALWILLLAVLEAASILLDRSHHIAWGRAGLALLKASYLAFAMVLLVRFLSFRNQKSFETMVESYNRLAAVPWTSSHGFGGEWRKLLFHMGLVVIASANFLTPWVWSRTSFQAGIFFDLAFWSLALRWVVRAHWLKALGRKENLKAGLDLARSRRREALEESPPMPNRAPAWPYLSLFAAGVAVTLALSIERWRDSGRNFLLGDLKACLRVCLAHGLERFHRDGELIKNLDQVPCLARHREKVEVTMGFQRGELLLWAIEKPGRDYLENGRNGDQGLMLDAEGRFRNTGR